jgi:hypothetical protein
MTPLLVISLMVVVAVFVVAKASRRGFRWMLAAMAVVGAWLAVTALSLRATNQFQAGEAARNYAVVMAVLLFLYFVGGKPRTHKQEI